MNRTSLDAHRHLWDRGPVVLCVDDDPGILNAVRRSLRDEPWDVITAFSPEEALGWLGAIPIHLVISDQRMPGMTGTQLLEVVRQRFPGTARLFLSGFPTPEAIRRGLEAGGAGVLSKPWNDEVFRSTIRRLLRRGGRPASPPDGSLGAGSVEQVPGEG
jgi:DNA-binding response OmpR family regulator